MSASNIAPQRSSSAPHTPSLLSHLCFDGSSYTRLATPTTPLTTLSFHLYPSPAPSSTTTTQHNTLLLSLTPPASLSPATSPSPAQAAYSLALRSHDRRLVLTLDDDDVCGTLTVTVSRQPVREYCWSTVQLDCSLAAGFRLTVVDEGGGRLDVSSAEPDRLSAPSTALHTPLTCSSLFVAGSPNHKPAQYFTGHIAALSLSPHTQLPPHPAHPHNTRLPPLPTRSRPLHSLAALLSTPPFSPLTTPPPPHPASPARSPHPYPAMLACHDMRGGYTDDHHPQSIQHSPTTTAYVFQHWSHIDTVVYFSHARVSVPAAGWVAAARREGVRVLGTVITEWDAGRQETVELVTRGGGEEYAKALVRLCEYYGFDGWLINIESPLLPALIPSLIHFLATLRQLLHASPHIRLPQLIWYDSLSAQTGHIDYQSHLHPTHTLPFFQAVDALFTDYHWQPHHPARSVQTAPPHRRQHVLHGIDVFGRGTYGGGGWAVRQAMDVVDRAGLGVALFGCGWTLEGLGLMGDRRRWERADRRFWLGDDVIEIDVHGKGEWTSVEEAMVGWQRSKLEADDAKEEKLDTQAEQRDRDWDSDEDWLKGWALVNDEHKGKVLVTSHRWCRRWRDIDLYAHGITPNILATTPLLITHTYRGTPPNPADHYQLRLTFLSASLAEVAGTAVVRREVCGSEWRVVRVEVSCEAAVRYVRWEEGGRDAEGWAGHYGCRLGRGTIELRLGGAKQDKAVGRQERRRKLPLHFPLLCSFNVGSGSSRWRGGRRLRHESQPLQPGEERQADVGQYGVMEEDKKKAQVGGEWSNLHEQDVQSYLCNALRAGETQHFMTCELCEDVAFEGGRSLCFTVRPTVDGGSVRDFDVLQFDTSAAPTAPPTTLILHLYLKEADGIDLCPCLRLRSGQLLDLETISQKTWGHVPGTGWSHKVFVFDQSPSDITGITIQARTWWPRTEPLGVKSYLGQLAFSSVGKECPMCSQLEEGGFSLASLVAWYLPSPSLTSGLYTVYLAWLPPMMNFPAHEGGRLSFGQSVTYEVEVDGVYVGNTKRCLYAMEGVSEQRLREGKWSVRCLLANGERQIGALPAVSALMLDTETEEEEEDEKRLFEESDARDDRKVQTDDERGVKRGRSGREGHKRRQQPLPPFVLSLVEEHCQRAGLVGEHGEAIKRQLIAHMQP